VFGTIRKDGKRGGDELVALPPKSISEIKMHVITILFSNY